MKPWRAVVAGAAGATVVVFLPPGAWVLMAAQFGFGVAGAYGAERRGWLAGILTGFPIGFARFAAYSIKEFHILPMEFWLLGVPAAVVSVGVAILGGLVGGWLAGLRAK
jgi:hypothetical protein